MSLRDQLLAKGLVSKKAAQRAERELKEERRAEQGSRKSKSELAAEERAAKAAEAERQRAELAERRRTAEEHRLAQERPRRLRNLVLGNRIRPGRGRSFFFVGPDRRHIDRLEVSSGTAFRLRCGELAIVALAHGGLVDVAVVPRSAAEEVRGIAPDAVLFFVLDTAGISDPSEAFHERTWETSLIPHRWTPPKK